MTHKQGRARRGPALVLLGMLLAAATTPAGAKDVVIRSASPYQLADILAEDEPAYDFEIHADLMRPEDAGARNPAFVFMHGSSGLLYRHQRYLALARRLGFVTLQVNSFRSRGVGSTIGNQANVTAAMMTIDALRALAFLAAEPDIDPDRIVIMGSSKGAIAALYAAWSPVRYKVVGRLDFAGYALLYPLCTDIEDGLVTEHPVRVFIGAEDNWTPPGHCQRMVERMRGLGRDFAITLYDGAFHAFDDPDFTIRALPHAYSMAACDIALRRDGYEIERSSGHLLTRAERRQAFRACARKGGVKIGGGQASTRLTSDIEAFLKTFRD